MSTPRIQPAGDGWLDLALIEADVARHSGQLLRDQSLVEDAVWHELPKPEGGNIQGVVSLVLGCLGDAFQLTTKRRVSVRTSTIKLRLGNRIDLKLVGFDPVC